MNSDFSEDAQAIGWHSKTFMHVATAKVAALGDLEGWTSWLLESEYGGATAQVTTVLSVNTVTALKGLEPSDHAL